MAQTEAAAYLIGDVYMGAAAAGADPQAKGNRSETVAPHDVYRAGGDDDWVALACHDDEAWQRCCEVIGVENRWPTNADRLADVEAVDAAVLALGWPEDWLPTEPSDCKPPGVSAMPVMGPYDHLGDKHLTVRGALDVLEHPVVGKETHVGNPIRFGLTQTRTAGPSPMLGVDTVEVFGEVLGHSPRRSRSPRRSGHLPLNSSTSGKGAGMKVLVMGGSQFNGYSLVMELVKHGHEVTVLNRGRTAVDFPRSVRRLVADRTDHDQVRSVLKDETSTPSKT